MKQQMIRFSVSVFALLLFAVNPLCADEAPPIGAGQEIWKTVIMFGIIFALAYMVIIRPEQKRRKVLEEMQKTLKEGDRVLAMGIVGTIVSLKENTVILKMVDGSQIEVVRGAITDYRTEEEEKKESD